MDLWLSIIGFLVVVGIIASIMTKKLSTLVALSLIPLIGAILVGQGGAIPSYLSAGISKVAVNGVMFVFAILFFGTMMPAGAFDPIVNTIVKWCKGNPLYVCLGTYALSTVGHLDGSATTTVLLVTTAMLPIYKRMHMQTRNLAAILAMAAGLMNMSPWGGPTLRAATVMEVDLTAFFQPMLIPCILTWVVGLVFTFLIGRAEASRLKKAGIDFVALENEISAEAASEEVLSLKRPKLTVVNIVIIIAVVAVMISGILSPGASFLVGTALAFLINYPQVADQGKIIRMHGGNVVLVVSALFGAGVLMGVLSGSGMAVAMANTIVSIIPNALSKFVPVIIGVFSVPFSLLFDADTFYYGLLPVLIESAKAMGLSANGICYAALCGQLTIGWAITPLTPATLLLVGACGLDLGEHQKYTIRYVWPLSIICLIFMTVFGLIL